MGYADLAVECDRPNAKGLERTILVCKKWVANHLDAETWLEDRKQELILAFPRCLISYSEISDLTEKLLNAKATFRFAALKQAKVTKSTDLRELDIADIEEDIETFKRDEESGIEPDPQKVLLCENKVNKSRASLQRDRDELDKASMTFFRVEVSLEWLDEQLDQRKQELTELKENFSIRLSELEPLLLQFAMSGAAIDQEIEQLVPSLSQHHQELVYAWLQSKWEVREANWGTLYGKLKTSTNEQRVETFRNLEQPVAPVVVSLQTDVLENGLDRETCSFRWGIDLFVNLSDEVMKAMELIEKNYNRGRMTTKQNLLKKSSQDSIGKLFRSGDAKRIGEMLVQVGSSVNLPPLNCP